MRENNTKEESEMPENKRRRQHRGFRMDKQKPLTIDESYQLERDKFKNADSMNHYAAVLKHNENWRGAVDEFYMLAQQSRDTANNWRNREYKENKAVVHPTEKTIYADEYAHKTTIGAANERRRLNNIVSLENKAKEYEEFAKTLCDRIGAPHVILFGNDDIRFRFIGEKGAARLDRVEEATFRLDNLSIAREMEFVGKDPLSIKQATGWERGADNLWRYEDSDLDINSEYLGKYKDDLTGSNIPTYNNNQISNGTVGRLSDFISDDKLFLSYPEIADWEVKIYNPRTNSKGVKIDGMIALSKDYFSEVYEILNSDAIATAQERVKELYDRIPEEIREESLELLDEYGWDHDRMSYATYRNMAERYPVIDEWIKAHDDIPFKNRGDLLGYRLNDNAKGVLSHEIQHAIQQIEGFSPGGSPTVAEGKYIEEIRSQREREAIKVKILSDKAFKTKEFEEYSKQTSGETVENQNLSDDEYVAFVEECKDAFENTEEYKAFKSAQKAFEEKFKLEPFQALDSEWVAKDMQDYSMDYYIRLSGEVEARNVQSRMGMSLEERRNSLAKLTEDVKREDQIFLKNTFSECMYSTKAEFIPVIESLSKSIHTSVNIIGDINELSDGTAKRNIEAGHNIKGWFSPATNDVTIYLPNIVDLEDAQHTVFHEAVAHYGLRKMFGVHFDNFLDNVYNNASSEIQGRIMYATHGNPSQRLIATEEYLAKLAEKGFSDKKEVSLWNQIKLSFIDMLKHAGVKLGFKLHDSDLRGILYKSYQNLVQNDLNNGQLLSSSDEEFKAAIKSEEYTKLSHLKESGYMPTKEVMQSLTEKISGNTLIAVQKIFGISSLGDSLAELDSLQGWLCDRNISFPSMNSANNYSID